MSTASDQDPHAAMASLGWLEPDPQPVRCSNCHDVIPGGDCGFGPDADLCKMCDYRRERAIAREAVMAELVEASRREAKIAETVEALKAELAANCQHDLIELLSVNGRNLDGAVRKCAQCGVAQERAA